MNDTGFFTLFSPERGSSVSRTLLKYTAISNALILSKSALSSHVVSGHVSATGINALALLLDAIGVADSHFHAFPMPSLPGTSPLLAPDSCLFQNLTLTLRLSQNTYTACPSLHNVLGVVVKKVSQLRIGHGSRTQVAYTHVISASLADRQVPAPLARILETVFAKSLVSLVIPSPADLDRFHLTGLSDSAFSDSLLLGPSVHISPLACDLTKVCDDDAALLYEYLVLLHRQSALVCLSTIDSYLSNYCVPELPPAPTLPLPPPFHTQYTNVHIRSVLSVLESDWVSISMRTLNSHVLLFRDVQGHVALYECEKVQW